MLVIGLTGGIGCGKSVVSDLFNRQFSIPIIDADIIAKQLTQTKPVIDKISAQLGAEYIDDNYQLLRNKLRQAIFSNPSTRDKLENILHPLVYDEIEHKLGKLDNDFTNNYCIVVIPLLLETKRSGFLDRILVVDCVIKKQVSRVMQRDNCSESHVRNIIDTQIDRDDRLRLADDIIENNDDIDSVKESVTSLHKKYITLSKTYK